MVDDLDPNNSPLNGFTRDHIIPKGLAKLTITVGELARTSTILTNFLVVDAPSAINGIIGRPLLKALKVTISNYHLTMKFLMAEGTGEVRGNQYYSRECYNNSLHIAKEDNKSTRASMGKAMASSSKSSGVTKQAHA